MNAERLSRVRRSMAEEDIAFLLLLDQLNIRWASGFTGSNGALLVTADDLHLFTDSRYTLQAADQAPLAIVHIANTPVVDQAAALLASFENGAIGFEPDVITWHNHRKLAEALPGAELMPVEALVNTLRYTKDPQEVDLVRRAAAITDEAFTAMLSILRPGMTEKEGARELLYTLTGLGADGESFPAIVASGPRAALPHAVPTDRAISAGEPLLLDFGAEYQGYAGDITRTLFVGSSTERFQEVYNVVLQAQQAAIDAIKPDVPGVEVDRVARDIIAGHGYGDCFGHGLGHQIGLDVHDGPALSPRSEVVLQEGMIVTVEPGIYLEGWGGVRIEDDVLVTASGCEIITSSPKHLIELPL